MQIRDKVCELNQQKMQCYLILVFMCSVWRALLCVDMHCVSMHMCTEEARRLIPQELSTLFLDRVSLWTGACPLDQTG